METFLQKFMKLINKVLQNLYKIIGFILQMMASDVIEAEFAYIAIENDENYQIECFNRVAVGNEIQIPLIIQRPTFIGVLATNTHANNFNIGNY